VELSDIILALVGIISTGTIFVIKNIMSDVRELEHSMTHCQTNLPKDYVLKSDYKDEMHEIKNILKDIQVILREQDGKKSR